ncbi:sensor histidine kinase [Gracilimonas mengyeensis]|uniref:histidine kinase n=1 Tax=Gracilimonas mengyeensis TaxID=1302730 RepID=A0A521FLH8_9BACT|nr:sensor histidine kinase [Gracilimonas mengyeensis]SMO97083.1 ligand-binding sensor domain-containing protein [Gracilimonas mengyeensis]
MNGLKIYIGLFSVIAGTLFPAQAIMAQHPGQINFRHISTREGLSQSTGNEILQDSKGYIWIGTQDGLNKYNGYEIKIYRHKQNDSTSIGSNDISALFEDSKQQLWIGTQGGGLNRYDPEKDSFVTIKELPDHLDKSKGLSDNTVFSISEDDYGNLWLATNSGINIKAAEADTFQYVFSDPGDPNTISDNYIETLFKDSRGIMWIGTEHGLNRYLPNKDIFERIEQIPLDDKIYTITEDRQGDIWIGTDNNGLYKYDYTRDTFSQYLRKRDDSGSVPVNSVFSIIEDSRGVLWIGTESNGLMVFDRQNNRFYQYLNNYADPTSLSNDAVYSLYESQDQILWIGTYTGGINLVDRKVPQVQHFQHNPSDPKSLSSNFVQAFAEDQEGNLWVGTDGAGLNLFDRNTQSFEIFLHDPNNPNSIANNSILEMVSDKRGNVWIGSYNGGATRYNVASNTYTHYKYDPEEGGISQNHIYAMMVDRKNRVWVGTNGEGVDTLSAGGNRFAAFGTDSVRVSGGAINIGYVRSLFEDLEGNIWIGTYGSGIVKFDPSTEKFNAYNTYNSNISNNVILSIHQDHKNRLWIGTKGGGLNHYIPEADTFRVYNENVGMPSATIYGILEDDSGNLWVSTGEGVRRFNPDRKTVQAFGSQDGFQEGEFLVGAAFKDKEGYFYFGGINGFNRFYPDSIKVDSTVHPIVFTDFKLFNRSVKIGGDSPLKKHISEAESITLSYQSSVFTFEYATLNFNEQKSNRYSYKMDGFDEEWTDIGEQRSATYTNLDPGEYTFRVKAYNSDNVISEHEASVDIIITPPFWETFWFYLIVGGVIAAAGFSVYRYRVRSIRERNIELERKVEKRTSELDKRNNELKQTLEDLETTRHELIEKAHKAGMADIATGVLHNVGNILNSVNTSAALIEDRLDKSKIKNLEKANDLLRQQLHDIESFIVDNPKGKQLLQYYLKLEEPLKEEQKNITELSKRLSGKIDLIKDVISAQQNYAMTSANSEEHTLSEIVDEAFMLNAGSSERHSIQVLKNYQSFAPIICQKTKLIHVLVNIFNNAKEAMSKNHRNDKVLKINLTEDDSRVYLSIEDNGHGITEKNLNKIFNQGFTTKKRGHGFGLHSSANYIQEMGGKIKVESDGEGKGARFIMSFKRADVD